MKADEMGKFTVTLLQISLANFVYSTQFPLLQFVKSFQGEIPETRYSNCVSWILILDPSDNSIVSSLASEIPQTSVVADLTSNNQTGELKCTFGSLRYHQPCSLVLMNLTGLQKRNLNPTSYSLLSTNIPGHPARVYNLIWLQASVHQAITYAKANLVTLPNPYVLLQQDNLVTIFTRNLSPDSWYKVGEYNQRTTDLLLSTQPFSFQGSTVVATVCTVCAGLIEDYKKVGIWRDALTATIYIFTSRFNGTTELEGVFGEPEDGTNEDGEWDAFIQPTIDGTAVFASLVKRSVENQHVIYHTTYMLQESVAFVTALPKRIQYSVIHKLYQPLSAAVWLAILISLIAVAASVEILIHLSLQLTTVQDDTISVRSAVVTRTLGRIRKPSMRGERHEHTNTIHAVLEPLVDQSGLWSPTFDYNIRRISTRIVVGLWFLLVIIINNGYRSVMTSLMVRPAYSKPPTTFRELLASDYYIGCVFFEGSIDGNLETLNNSFSRQLLKRIHSYNYFEPDCYQLIFEGENACVGFLKVFELLGTPFMVDVRYQQMAMLSKENMFPVVMGMGVSLYYPAVVDPLNRYIQALLNAGVYEKWWANGRWLQQTIGQRNAEEFAKVKNYYLGRDDSKQKSSEETLQMFVQIFAYGILVATIGFIFELAYKFASTKCLQLE